MESSLVESALDFEIMAGFLFLFFICNLTLFNLTTWGRLEHRREKKQKVEPPTSSEFPLKVAWDTFTETLLLEELQPDFAETWELRRELKLQYVHAQLPQLKLLGCFRLSVQYPVLAKAR